MTAPDLRVPADDLAEIEAARSAGDRDRALTLLMARHGEDVYRFAITMTHDRDLAEEVRRPATLRKRVARALPVRRRCVEAALRDGSR